MSGKTMIQIDADKLRTIRESKVMTIGDLAEKSGVHRNRISSFENRHSTARPDTVRVLAKALSVDPEDLVKAPHQNRPSRGLPRAV
jgi:predicted transcriptional regulator